MTGAERMRDAFPVTAATWLVCQLDGGAEARSLALRHVMEVYREPLTVYCRGCSLSWVGESSDLVSGFFADRLSRDAFLDRWRESRRPLRFWLIVGFKHYLYEQARSTKRHAHDRVPIVIDDAGLGVDRAPDREFERACAVDIVRAALNRTAERCQTEGLADHWSVFVLHHVRGMSYAQVETRLGLPRARSAVMVRTVSKRFREEILGLVAWEGATSAEMERELADLMRSCAP